MYKRNPMALKALESTRIKKLNKIGDGRNLASLHLIFSRASQQIHLKCLNHSWKKKPPKAKSSVWMDEKMTEKKR